MMKASSYLNGKGHLLSWLVIICLLSLSNSACLSSQFLNSTTSLCVPCQKPCATCANSTSCNSCKPGLVLLSSWLSSFFGNGKICACSGTGLFYSPYSLVCTTCSGSIPNCITCTSTVSGATCTTCAAGFYKVTAISCLACPVGCSTCTSSTLCSACASGYTLVSGLCSIPCSTLISQCSTCTTSPVATCTACKLGFYLSSNTCIACGPSCSTCNVSGCITCSVGFLLISATCTSCSTALSVTGCTSCTSSLCTACLTSSGYVLNTTTNICDFTSIIGCLTGEALIGGVCQLCSTSYDSQCLQCNSTVCTLCTTGYVYNATSLICEIICAANEVSISGTCQLCSQLYSLQCSACTPTECTACLTGFFYNATSLLCQVNPISPVCGDGLWIDFIEPCDDGNFINLDGCDSQCQVQPDYTCLVVDQLPSGASLCKFTKNFTIRLDYIQKEPSSNIAHAFLVIEPPTFQQWTIQEIQNLMSPVTIVDQATGTSTVVPLNSLNFAFQRINGQNQVELIIDYGSMSVEGTYLQFNVDPTATTLPSIQSLSPQPINFAKLSSLNNAVDLYSYTDETYQFQKSVSAMSAFVGYTALVFAFLGLLCPLGKLIVLEALVVIQLSFFSILQFRKIPPTFIGFKNLIFSNGYNDPNLFQSGITQNDQTVFKLMGLDQSIFVNYNISFIVFFWVPFFVGLVGMIINFISKRSVKKENELTDEMIAGKEEQNQIQTESGNQNFEGVFKLNIFKRIFFEVSFYGILLTGYLAWVSIFQGLKSENLSNALGSVLIFLIWAFYGFKFVMEKTGHIDLKKKPETKNQTLTEENSLILDGFGEFKELSRQVSMSETFEDGKTEILYVCFMFEKIAVSLVIEYLSTPTYCSGGIVAIYAIFLIAFIITYRKSQNAKEQAKRKSLFSYLSRNYILRQAINFITIIVIQSVIIGFQLASKNAGASEDVLTVNEGIGKVVPMVILSLIMANLGMNIFLWVWEIKSSQLLYKTKHIGKLFLGKTGEKMQNESEKEKEQGKGDEGNSVRRIMHEESEVEAAMGKMFDIMIANTPKNSPFIGIQEKEGKGKLNVSKLNAKIEQAAIVEQNLGEQFNGI